MRRRLGKSEWLWLGFVFVRFSLTVCICNGALSHFAEATSPIPTVIAPAAERQGRLGSSVYRVMLIAPAHRTCAPRLESSL